MSWHSFKLGLNSVADERQGECSAANFLMGPIGVLGCYTVSQSGAPSPDHGT
jgi:hypothetical protein